MKMLHKYFQNQAMFPQLNVYIFIFLCEQTMLPKLPYETTFRTGFSHYRDTLQIGSTIKFSLQTLILIDLKKL